MRISDWSSDVCSSDLTATQSADTRKTIADQLSGVRDQLLALANTSDGQGRYLFGGADDGSAPFSWNGSSADYHGDQTTATAQIGSQRAVAPNDPGNDVVMGLKNDTGRLSVTGTRGHTASAGGRSPQWE